MMGPLGLLSPHPGVSYLFSGTEAAPMSESESSLWGIAHANLGVTSGLYGGALGSPPPSWTTALGDTIRQIDAKLKVSFSSHHYLNLASMCCAENHRDVIERT
jgi:hypothetical protein